MSKLICVSALLQEKFMTTTILLQITVKNYKEYIRANTYLSLQIYIYIYPFPVVRFIFCFNVEI